MNVGKGSLVRLFFDGIRLLCCYTRKHRLFIAHVREYIITYERMKYSFNTLVLVAVCITQSSRSI